MNGFEKRRIEKKRVIREVALKLFLEKGVEHVTINQIAAEAQVSHVSIYNFFGSKSDLINELALSIICEIQAQYEEIFRDNSEIDEKLRKIFNINFDLVRTGQWGFLFNVTKTNRELKSSLDHMLSPIKQTIVEFVIRGKETGILKPDIRVESILLRREMFTVYFEHNETARAYISSDSDMVKDIQNIFWYGVLK